MRTARFVGFSLLLASVLLACQTTNEPAVEPFRSTDGVVPKTASVINLIATPERYNGQAIHVFGWVGVGFELQALYYSPELLQHGSAADSVWLVFDDSFIEHTNPASLDGCFVRLVGTFDKDNHGTMGLYPGGIVVKHLEVLEKGAIGSPVFQRDDEEGTV